MLTSFKKLFNSQAFLKLFKNTSWLAAEKFIRMFSALIVGILVARYLGPEQYGKLAYCISVTMLFSMLTHLGLDGMTVRELVKRPEEKAVVMGTVFSMKYAISVVASISMVAFAWFTAEETIVWLLLTCLAISLLLDPKIVFEFWFESRIQGKHTAKAKVLSLLGASLYKIMLVAFSVSLYWFGFAYLLEAMLLLLLLFWFYRQTSELATHNWYFSSKEAKALLSRSWMVMIGSACAMIYKKVDQAMLMWLQGAEEVGVYAVAAQLSEVWNFLPMVIVASVYPILIKLKDKSESEYQTRLQQVFDLLALLAIGLAVCTTIVAEPLINTLFGVEFARSAEVLVIHIWSCIFIFYRALFGKWIHIEQVLMFSLITQGLGAISNVVLNLYLIPLHGAVGAAYATLISYSLASFVSLIFYSKTRSVFVKMCLAFTIPFRINTALKQLASLKK